MKRFYTRLLQIAIAITLTLLSAHPVAACLNGFDELLEETVHASRLGFPVPKGHPMNMKNPNMQKSIERFKKGYEKGEYESSINYGLYLVYDKQYEEAEKVFKEVAKKFPGKYEAASNYGTILEV